MGKLNIAELLRDCPKGMELDCMMYEDVYFDYVDELNIIHCYIQNEGFKTSITFNQHGTPHSDAKSKCVIFPKGKTTWEGFVPPCQFKDGDVVSVIVNRNLWYGIYQKEINAVLYCYASYSDSTQNLYSSNKNGMCLIDDIVEMRLATEEEKQKLFDAIVANGYKWNAETKTLEKLIEPKFKVGDRIVHKRGGNPFTITEIINGCYKGGTRYAVLITQQDNFELAPNKFDINTLKPFESRVLIRNVGAWEPAFWGYYSKEYAHPFVVAGGNTFAQCIPYENNEHLLGTTNDCDDFYKTWEK